MTSQFDKGKDLISLTSTSSSALEVPASMSHEGQDNAPMWCRLHWPKRAKTIHLCSAGFNAPRGSRQYTHTVPASLPQEGQENAPTRCRLHCPKRG
ncbi:hypothetical protein OWV82_022524 [Melia azedarach]|uniref:Uncharacterized protein n=1 Tax=Melia azedarach TaxID=155640 RepID=A0ACC1WU07_MELAZ|nr:hypothetical protein OWV82_022524 [Melia azedarach]